MIRCALELDNQYNMYGEGGGGGTHSLSLIDGEAVHKGTGMLPLVFFVLLAAIFLAFFAGGPLLTISACLRLRSACSVFSTDVPLKALSIGTAGINDCTVGCTRLFGKSGVSATLAETVNGGGGRGASGSKS